jgi:hypothetical protein
MREPSSVQLRGREIEVDAARSRNFECAYVAASNELLSLSLKERSKWILSTVHGASMQLAELRGFDTEPLRLARDHVEACEYGFTWTGNWKASPDRRLRARCHYELEANGFGELKVEVRDKNDELIGYTSPQHAWTTFESFKRSAKTFRWLNSASFTVIPTIGIYGLIGDEFMVGIALSGEGAGSLEEGPSPAPV